jgi:hypothetical protein
MKPAAPHLHPTTLHDLCGSGTYFDVTPPVIMVTYKKGLENIQGHTREHEYNTLLYKNVTA